MIADPQYTKPAQSKDTQGAAVMSYEAPTLVDLDVAETEAATPTNNTDGGFLS